MVSKVDISRLTGLTGVEVDHIVRFLEKKGVDWQQEPDWETIGQDVADFADKYDAVWDKLIEHGVVTGRPLPISEIGRQEEIWKEEEEEWLLGTKEGVKELLSRIYKNGLTKKEEERLKEKVLNRPEFATLIALYNGEEQEYAKRYLAEMVVAPARKDIKELLKADILKIRSERGWIRSINDVPVKGVRSIDIAGYLADFEPVASEKVDDTVAVYKRKEVEKPEIIIEVEKPKTREELEKEIKEIEQRLQRIKEKERPMIKTIIIEYDVYNCQMFPVRFYDKETMDKDVHTVDKWFHGNIVEKNKPFKSYIDRELLTSERSNYYFGYDVGFMVR